MLADIDYSNQMTAAKRLQTRRTMHKQRIVN
uniref:Membrane protein BRI3 n=1 Tax=Parascaris univalens TaxID=6257 RepID=A0A915BCA5_PARUN